jgi:hypothetical protein
MKLYFLILISSWLFAFTGNTFPVEDTSPTDQTNEVDLELRLSLPQYNTNHNKEEQVKNKIDLKREKRLKVRRLGMRRKRQEIREMVGKQSCFI